MTVVAAFLSRSIGESSDLAEIVLLSVAGLFVSAIFIRNGIDLGIDLGSMF